MADVKLNELKNEVTSNEVSNEENPSGMPPLKKLKIIDNRLTKVIDDKGFFDKMPTKHELTWNISKLDVDENSIPLVLYRFRNIEIFELFLYSDKLWSTLKYYGWKDYFHPKQNKWFYVKALYRYVKPKDYCYNDTIKHYLLEFSDVKSYVFDHIKHNMK